MPASGTPGNDAWVNAFPIAGASGSTPGTTVDATVEPGEPFDLNGVPTNQTVWWKWVAPSSGTFTFDVKGDSLTTLAVYTGASIDALTRVTFDADGSQGLENRIFLDAVDGTTYSIQVGVDPSGAEGGLTLTWKPNVVVNDDFANAIALGGNSGSVTGWNVGATLEPPDEPGSQTCCLGNSVWYSWTPSANGAAEVTLNTDFSERISVFTGTTLASLQFLTFTSFDAVAGTTYWIQIGSFDSGPGTFDLAWNLTLRPPNDNLAAAAPVTGGLISQSGTTIAATIEGGEPTSVDLGNFSHNGRNSVWYRWSPPATGAAVFSVDAEQVDPSAPLVQVYEGPAANPGFIDLVPVGTHDPTANDPNDTVHVQVNAAKTYYIQVMGDLTSEQHTEFGFTLTARFDNDLFANATQIFGAEGSIRGTTGGATYPESGEPDPTDTTDQTVWYAWKAPGTGRVDMFVAAADYNATAAVYSGSALVDLFAEDSDSGSVSLHLSFHAAAGTTYYIQVGIAATGSGPFNLSWSQHPANDDWADSSALDGDAGSLDGTNVAATLEPPDEPGSGVCCLGNSVWYSWTPSSNGDAQISLDAAFDASLAVYTGDALDGLAVVDSDEDSSTPSVSFTAEAGTRYYVQVGTYDDSPGTFALSWSLAGSAPPNDDWANAEFASGSSGSAGGTNINATVEPGEQTEVTVDGVVTAQTVWWKWVAPSTSTFLFDTFGSDFDTVLAVYTGSSLATLSELTDNDDAGSGHQSAVGFAAEAGTTYYLQVGSFDPGFGAPEPGTIVLNWRQSSLANDNFADATVLAGDTGSIDGSNVDATIEPGEPDLTFGGLANSVWYAWTPTHNGRASMSFSADFLGSLAIYTGTALASLTEAGSDYDGTSLSVSFDAVADTTYYVQVGSYDDAPGPFTLSWKLPPANDDLADAADISGASGAVDGTTIDATTEDSENTVVDVGTSRPGRNTVWYRWTAPASGEMAFSVAAHADAFAHTPLIQLYQGPPSAPLYPLEVVGSHDGFDRVTYTVDGGDTYYVQILSDIISETNPNFDFTLAWDPTPREISGSVRDAVGATVPGILVRACLGVTCSTTTTNSDGNYGFTNLAVGVYTVNALPTDPTLLAAQTDADVTLASAQRVDLKLSASGASSTPNGPSTFEVTGCSGGTLTYIATADGVVLVNGTISVPDGANNTPVDGVYLIDISAFSPGHPAMLQFDTTITCPDSPTETETAVLFADPAGTVVDDAAGGAALAGATVTLLDSNGTQIPPNDPRLSPATAANPETSDTRGAWAWDVAPATYLVRADKTNCGTATSAPLVVTAANPVTGVVLHLSCGATPTQPPAGFPPTNPPPSGLPDPVAGVNFNVVPISGTVLVNGVLLPDAKQIPFGATIDATNGIVSITTIGPNGLPQTAFFYGGVFQLLQGPGGVTNLLLVGGDFSVCPVVTAKAKPTSKTKSTAGRTLQGVLAAQAKAPPKNSKKVVRAIWGSGKGSFRTTGRFSSATVRGTLWYNADRCDGTYTKVNVGTVTVLDLPRNKILIVKAPSSVLVRPK